MSTSSSAMASSSSADVPFSDRDVVDAALIPRNTLTPQQCAGHWNSFVKRYSKSYNVSSQAIPSLSRAVRTKRDGSTRRPAVFNLFLYDRVRRDNELWYTQGQKGWPQLKLVCKNLMAAAERCSEIDLRAAVGVLRQTLDEHEDAIELLKGIVPVLLPLLKDEFTPSNKAQAASLIERCLTVCSSSHFANIHRFVQGAFTTRVHWNVEWADDWFARQLFTADLVKEQWWITGAYKFLRRAQAPISDAQFKQTASRSLQWKPTLQGRPLLSEKREALLLDSKPLHDFRDTSQFVLTTEVHPDSWFKRKERELEELHDSINELVDKDSGTGGRDVRAEILARVSKLVDNNVVKTTSIAIVPFLMLQDNWKTNLYFFRVGCLMYRFRRADTLTTVLLHDYAFDAEKQLAFLKQMTETTLEPLKENALPDVKKAHTKRVAAVKDLDEKALREVFRIDTKLNEDKTVEYTGVMDEILDSETLQAGLSDSTLLEKAGGKVSVGVKDNDKRTMRAATRVEQMIQKFVDDNENLVLPLDKILKPVILFMKNGKNQDYANVAKYVKTIDRLHELRSAVLAVIAPQDKTVTNVDEYWRTHRCVAKSGDDPQHWWLRRDFDDNLWSTLDPELSKLSQGLESDVERNADRRMLWRTVALCCAYLGSLTREERLNDEFRFKEYELWIQQLLYVLRADSDCYTMWQNTLQTLSDKQLPGIHNSKLWLRIRFEIIVSHNSEPLQVNWRRLLEANKLWLKTMQNAVANVPETATEWDSTKTAFEERVAEIYEERIRDFHSNEDSVPFEPPLGNRLANEFSDGIKQAFQFALAGPQQSEEAEEEEEQSNDAAQDAMDVDDEKQEVPQEEAKEPEQYVVVEQDWAAMPVPEDAIKSSSDTNLAGFRYLLSRFYSLQSGRQDRTAVRVVDAENQIKQTFIKTFRENNDIPLLTRAQKLLVDYTTYGVYDVDLFNDKPDSVLDAKWSRFAKRAQVLIDTNEETVDTLTARLLDIKKTIRSIVNEYSELRQRALQLVAAASTAVATTPSVDNVESEAAAEDASQSNENSEDGDNSDSSSESTSLPLSAVDLTAQQLGSTKVWRDLAAFDAKAEKRLAKDSETAQADSVEDQEVEEVQAQVFEDDGVGQSDLYRLLQIRAVRNCMRLHPAKLEVSKLTLDKLPLHPQFEWEKPAESSEIQEIDSESELSDSSAEVPKDEQQKASQAKQRAEARKKASEAQAQREAVTTGAAHLSLIIRDDLPFKLTKWLQKQVPAPFVVATRARLATFQKQYEDIISHLPFLDYTSDEKCSYELKIWRAKLQNARNSYKSLLKDANNLTKNELEAWWQNNSDTLETQGVDAEEDGDNVKENERGVKESAAEKEEQRQQRAELIYSQQSVLAYFLEQNPEGNPSFLYLYDEFARSEHVSARFMRRAFKQVEKINAAITDAKPGQGVDGFVIQDANRLQWDSDLVEENWDQNDPAASGLEYPGLDSFKLIKVIIVDKPDPGQANPGQANQAQNNPGQSSQATRPPVISTRNTRGRGAGNLEVLQDGVDTDDDDEKEQDEPTTAQLDADEAETERLARVADEKGDSDSDSEDEKPVGLETLRSRLLLENYATPGPEKPDSFFILDLCGVKFEGPFQFDQVYFGSSPFTKVVANMMQLFDDWSQQLADWYPRVKTGPKKPSDLQAAVKRIYTRATATVDGGKELRSEIRKFLEKETEERQRQNSDAILRTRINQADRLQSGPQYKIKAVRFEKTRREKRFKKFIMDLDKKMTAAIQAKNAETPSTKRGSGTLSNTSSSSTRAAKQPRLQAFMGAPMPTRSARRFRYQGLQHDITNEHRVYELIFYEHPDNRGITKAMAQMLFPYLAAKEQERIREVLINKSGEHKWHQVLAYSDRLAFEHNDAEFAKLEKDENKDVDQLFAMLSI